MDELESFVETTQQQLEPFEIPELTDILTLAEHQMLDLNLEAAQNSLKEFGQRVGRWLEPSVNS